MVTTVANATIEDTETVTQQLLSILNNGGRKWFVQRFTKEGKRRSVWFDADDDWRRFYKHYRHWQTGQNVYFGVNPTSKSVTDKDRAKFTQDGVTPKDSYIEQYVGSKNDTIAAVNCVFTEIDGKDFTFPSEDEIAAHIPTVTAEKQKMVDSGEFKRLPSDKAIYNEAVGRAKQAKYITAPAHYNALALAHLESAPLKASVCWCSGGGYQAVWLFDQTFVIDSQDARELIQWLQAAWVGVVGGDDGAKDIRRILRLPGTQNVKKHWAPNYPTVCYEWADFDKVYGIDQIIAHVPARPQKSESQQHTITPQSSNGTGTAYDGDSVIDRFNATYKVVDILGDNGYTGQGSERSRPGAPSSNGVNISDDGFISWHWSSNDPLYNPKPDGNPHKTTSFTAFLMLEHGGNMKKAVRAAAELLDMGRDRDSHFGAMDETQQTGAELIASLSEVATADKRIDPDTGEIIDGDTATTTAKPSAKLRMSPGRRIKYPVDGVKRIVKIKALNTALTVEGGPNVYDAEYADDNGANWPITVSDDDDGIELMTASAPKPKPAAPKPVTWNEITREIARITATYETPEERQAQIVTELSAHIGTCERSKHMLLVTALQHADAGFTKTDATKFIDNCVRDAKKANKEKPKKTETEVAAESGVNTWPYGVEDGCIVEYWTDEDDDGESVVKNTKLCNFNAWIVADVAVDDGEGITRKIAIAGTLGNGAPLPEIIIRADDFESMQWVVASWGARANIAPGKGTKDTLRHAIQTLSAGNMRQRNSRSHTGWAVVNGKRVFIHNDGAIGDDGVSVELPHNLNAYRLPTDNAIDYAEAMRESIRLMDIANAKISAPLWAAVYLAPLSEFISPAFVVSVEGGSGSLKSSLSAVMLNHYGAKFEENKSMPADWLGTANSIEKLCYHAKDVAVVIDDLRPTSSPAEHKELMAKVNHIVRAVGNRQGRSRLDSNSEFKRTYAPRGVVIMTAERKAMGKSTNSRILTLDVEPGDIDGIKLSVAQRQRHIYGYAMAGYIKWIADNWDALETNLPGDVAELRAKNAVDGQHKRLPNATAVLYAAFDTAMTYATEIGAISEDEAAERLEALQKALTGIAETQNETTEDEDPAQKYINIIATLIAQEKAYIVAKGDKLGKAVKNIGECSFGERLGWHDGQHIYLLPGAYNAVCKYASAEGWIFPSDEPTLRKELQRAGYITKTDAGKLTSNQRAPGEAKVRPATAISLPKFAEVLESMGVDKKAATGVGA